MHDGPEWFAAKRFGYGSGFPIAWQGWLVLAIYLAVMVGAAYALHGSPLALIGVVLPATVLLMLITAKTTRGGWRWRWGKDD
ncbi:MAG TPA: hypothetical protein VHN55_00545 [Sphingomicrobium sp.]|nr:hypothetical protein [Sphingomicrobium sp.]